MDAPMPPEQVEILARTIASKLEIYRRSSDDLDSRMQAVEANQVVIFERLGAVRRERTLSHFSAIICAVIALLIATLAMFSQARATRVSEQLLEEIQKIPNVKASSGDAGAPSR